MPFTNASTLSPDENGRSSTTATAIISTIIALARSYDLDTVAEQAQGGAGPDEMVIVRQELDAVEAALTTLTDEQREAIALRFFSGLSAREAAEAMGKQEGTIRGLQFRAIAALRRELEIDERETALRTDGRTARPVRATNDG